MLPLDHIIQTHGLNIRCYGNDIQIYGSTKSPAALLPQTLLACIQDIKI
uniref:Uncharacterized protein n=1 Tax=Anguilla anguilla TaxID=7936 RepID=A0A0E9UKZ3_ANGAN